jgi:hypothetical protein
MKPLRTLFFAICTLGIPYTPALAQQVTAEILDRAPGPAYRDWTVFLQPRLGYQLPVPPGVRALGDPETAAKTTFVSTDRMFAMSTWGAVSRQPTASVLEAQWRAAKNRPGRAINYERKGRSWFVISGTDESGTEFYEKVLVSGDRVAGCALTYPRARLREFESWVERIEDGFRVVAPPVARSRPASQLAFGTSGARSRWSLQPTFSTQSPTRSSRSTPGTRPAAESTVPPSELENPKGDLTQSLQRTEPNIAVRESTPMDEPDTPRVEDTDRSAPAPQPKPAASEAKDLPVGEKVPGKEGFLYSPYTPARSLVDVVGIPSGTKVRCPYTRKIFRVP